MAVGALLLCILSVFPQHYMALSELLPKAPGGGLSAMLGAGGGGGLNLSDILGQKTSIETDLAVARSHVVTLDVIQALKLNPSGDIANRIKIERQLEHKVSIEAIRGSIILIDVYDSDSARALEITKAYTKAIQTRLGALNLNEAVGNRILAEGRLQDASIRLSKAEAELSQFRDANKLALPVAQLGAGIQQLAALQARLQAKDVELQMLEKFATKSNVQVQAVSAEISALRGQIKSFESVSPSGPSGLPEFASKNDKYLNLYRNEQFAEVLYGIYSRYLESTTIDELSSNDNVTVIDAPYISPDIQFNMPVVAALFLLVSVFAAAEFYIFSPPPGFQKNGSAKNSHG